MEPGGTLGKAWVQVGGSLHLNILETPQLATLALGRPRSGYCSALVTWSRMWLTGRVVVLANLTMAQFVIEPNDMRVVAGQC